MEVLLLWIWVDLVQAGLLSPSVVLTGEVFHEATGMPAETAEVVLTPAWVTPSASIDAIHDDGAEPPVAVVDSAGRFTFGALGPGAYRLRVGTGEMVMHEVPQVIVPKDVVWGTVSVPEPLLLRSPEVLEVYVSPPLDPYDRPWRLFLVREEGDRNLVEVPAATIHPSPAGYWSVEGLRRGNYRLQVEASDRARWHLERFEIADGAPPLLQLDLPYVPVEGNVRGGDEPVVGTLWFGGRHGERRVRMDTDEEGRYVGVLPEEGEWRVHLEREDLGLLQDLGGHEVALVDGHVLARVDFDLPDTRLIGRVLDADGEPFGSARLMLANLSDRLRNRVETDPEGQFEVTGLEPGRLMVQAEAGDERSQWVTVELQEHLDPPLLELVMEQRRRTVGTVVSGGRPVPGGQIQALAVLEMGTRERFEATCGGDGRFELDLPASVQRVDLLVSPPGHAATVVSLLPGEEPVNLEVPVTGGLLEVEVGEEPPNSFALLANGASLGLDQLLAWARFGGGGLRDGRISVPGLAAGEYGVCRRRSGPPQCASGTLAGAGPLTLRPLGDERIDDPASGSDREGRP